MRTLYRSMKADQDGRPACGPSARTLGARIPDDLSPDAWGVVHPCAGGMSVTADDPRALPFHRRPPEFGGMGRDPVYKLAEARLVGPLVARPEADGATHWFVEPRSALPVDRFQAALCATRRDWEMETP
jgi:hypothetical protein